MFIVDVSLSQLAWPRLHNLNDEGSGSVVECLTRDLGVASWSLTGGTQCVLFLNKTLYPLLSTGYQGRPVLNCWLGQWHKESKQTNWKSNKCFPSRNDLLISFKVIKLKCKYFVLMSIWFIFFCFYKSLLVMVFILYFISITFYHRLNP